MGKTAADVQHEIEELRKETGLLVCELESRLKDATNLRTQMRRHPAITASAGISLLSGLGLAGYIVYSKVRQDRKPATLVRRRASAAKEVVEDKAWRLGRIFTARSEKGSEENMLKRILYAAMTAGMVALATFLARRMAATLWSNTMQETPPSEPR